jgi:hypothetical protein
MVYAPRSMFKKPDALEGALWAQHLVDALIPYG